MTTLIGAELSLKSPHVWYSCTHDTNNDTHITRTSFCVKWNNLKQGIQTKEIFTKKKEQNCTSWERWLTSSSLLHIYTDEDDDVIVLSIEEHASFRIETTKFFDIGKKRFFFHKRSRLWCWRSSRMRCISRNLSPNRETSWEFFIVYFSR